MTTGHRYTLRLQLSVLDHLGLNLYSNIPAVLSETVANAWDADATTVDIRINVEKQSVQVSDNGTGMNSNDLDNKFLAVGYQRREADPLITPVHKRHVMGRKGIGKLSLFSIADMIEVRTAKRQGGRIEKAGCVLKAADIRAAIKSQGVYYPNEISPAKISMTKGTTISVKDLRIRVTAATEKAVRRRLARRFSILGPANSFTVRVNGRAVGVADRDYFKKIEYLWSIGNVKAQYEDLATNAKKKKRIAGVVDTARGYEVTGWVGTVDERKSLGDDENNAISILAWGKLAQEDILKELREGGLYTKYLMGEIRADFVDWDHKPDIATSDRQRLKEDDDRYRALVTFIRESVLRKVENSWRDWRSEDALGKALENSVVKEWYGTLKGDTKNFAKQLFGRIGSFPMQDDAARTELYRYGILAFERLRFQDSLSSIDSIANADDLLIFEKVFSGVDDLEAAEYHQIVRGRLEVIEKFINIVDTEKERVIQRHLFDHLWLLHPSWERASTNQRVEASMKKVFKKVAADLTADERKGRLDIQYRTAAGKNIVIELKKYDAVIKFPSLLAQLEKYRAAMEKCLKQFPTEPQQIELIAVLGQPYSGMQQERGEAMLRQIGARVITYDTLIQESLDSYKDYLEANKRISRVAEIISRLGE